MKKFKHVLCFLLLCFIFVNMASCGNKKNVGTKGVLHIASFEGGYGNTWASKLAEKYMEYNPETKVVVDCNPLVRDDAVTAAQTNKTSVDLFFIDGINVGSYCETYGSLADISALYSSTPKAGDKEENTTIAEKIRPEIVESMMYQGDQNEFKGKYYTAPSPSGPCSLVLNVDALNNALGKDNWTVPVTTDEFFALCDEIKAKEATVKVGSVNYDVYPFIYAGFAVEYLRYMYYPWIAQYDGLNNWDSFMSVKINGQYNQDAYFPEGKLKAYTELEKLLKRTNEYCETSSMGNKHTESQKYFFQGRACMYVTGDWLERESEDNTSYNPNLMMVRTPVISSLVEKIETEFLISLGATQSEKDQKLAEIVRSIDNGNTSFDGISLDVFNRIKEARSITYTLASSAVGFVPECSVNKDLAIDFLRFMYSDEGVKIVLDESRSYLPVINTSSINVKAEDLTMFRQSVNTIATGNTTFIAAMQGDPIRYRAGLDYFVGNEKPEVALGKKSGALTAYSLIEKEKKLLAQQWADLIPQV